MPPEGACAKPVWRWPPQVGTCPRHRRVLGRSLRNGVLAVRKHFRLPRNAASGTSLARWRARGGLRCQAQCACWHASGEVAAAGGHLSTSSSINL